MCQMKTGTGQEGLLIRSFLQCLIPAFSEASAVRTDCHITTLRQLHTVIIMVEFDHPFYRGNIIASCHAEFTCSLMPRKGKKTFLLPFVLLRRDQYIHRHIYFRLYLKDHFFPTNAVLQLHDFFHAGGQITGLHIFPSQKLFQSLSGRLFPTFPFLSGGSGESILSCIVIEFLLHSLQASVEVRDLNDRICLFHDCSLHFHFLLLLFLPFSALCVQSVFHISCKKALQPGMRQPDP